MDCDRSLAAYDYTLPESQIAQSPAVPRDSARLLVVQNPVDQKHTIFRELPDLLRSGDLLVLNNTRVLPARLYGRKETGVAVEVLLLEPQPSEADPEDDFSREWLALVKPGKRLKPGTEILFDPVETNADRAIASPPLVAKVLATDPATGGRLLRFEVPAGQTLKSWIYQIGQVPLPPYITASEASPDQYQTVYADPLGSVAAPTAGLHFTPELLERLEAQNIQRAFVTLHVGVGTFRPVEVEDITTHEMHGEWAEVSAETVQRIQETRAKGGRIIAVGTTSIRALEGAAQTGTLCPFYGKTHLFIYPGYQWQVVDGFITNFHLPKSSLMMLVSAFIGRQRLLDLYQLAIAEQYRFYSFGDAMLVLPEAKVEPT